MDLSHFSPEIFLLSSSEEALQNATGDNAKGVAVVAQVEEGAEMDLLLKILKSVELDGTKDILLLKSTPATRFSLTAFCRQTDCKTVLLFGIEPTQLGLQLRMEKYTPFEISGLKGLWADSLPKLEASRELKSALWSSLKSLLPSH